jgi:hypothetical protein
MHVILEIVSALLATIPIASIAQAYRTTPSTRLALALAAFLILEAKFLAYAIMHLMYPDTFGLLDQYQEELLGFVDDVAVMMMFAIAFLWGTRWSLDRVRTEHA